MSNPTDDTGQGTPPNAPRRRSPLGQDGRVYVPRELLAALIAAPPFALWVVLATHLRRDQYDAFPSRTTIGHALGGIAPATVSRLVVRLEAAGWLGVVRVRANRHSRNYYRPLRTIAPAGNQQHYVEIGRDELDALEEGRINASEFRALARWYDRAGREGWTRDTLEEYAAHYGTSVRTARRDRSALVAAELLEVDDPQNPTVTARPGRLPAARSDAQQTPARVVTPARPRTSPQPGQNRHTEVTPVEATPVEATPCGPARRARNGSNARPAATTTPPAPKPETITQARPANDEQARALNDAGALLALLPVEYRQQPPAPKPETITQARPANDEQARALNDAGALLALLPVEYRQQPLHFRRQLVRRLAPALTDYGPDAIVYAVNRHDRPDVNAFHTLDAALCGLAADVKAGDACRECGHDTSAPRPICHVCQPDRDTLTAAELAALAATYGTDNLPAVTEPSPPAVAGPDRFEQAR